MRENLASNLFCAAIRRLWVHSSDWQYTVYRDLSPKRRSDTSVAHLVSRLLVRTMAGDPQMYNVIFVLGGPGAGKGTQCERIEKEFGYVHISAGDLLRVERQKTDSQFREEIETHFKNGSIVPVEITCSLLRQAMDQSQKQNFLIDGFPRNKDNLDGWNRVMNSVARVQKVLFFNCPDDVCVNRCMDRGKTSGRTDDNMESLKKRITIYRESTMPIIEHYRSQNLVAELNANQTLDEVFAGVRKVFGGLSS